MLSSVVGGTSTASCGASTVSRLSEASEPRLRFVLFLATLEIFSESFKFSVARNGMPS
jgi:hypothetical protein